MREHIADLTKKLYHFEQFGELPKRHNTDHIPLKESALSLHRMQEFAEYGNPTNVELWRECLWNAEEVCGGENKAIVFASVSQKILYPGVSLVFAFVIKFIIC